MGYINVFAFLPLTVYTYVGLRLMRAICKEEEHESVEVQQYYYRFDVGGNLSTTERRGKIVG
jgi:hypothetical protein